MAKKTSHTNNKDWHPADVVAAVRKRGSSLSRLSRLNDLSSGMCKQALYKPYPKMEGIIAKFLDTKPNAIWPSRYNSDGTPKSGRGQRNLGRHSSNLKSTTTSKLNHTRISQRRNVNQVDNSEMAA